MKLPASETNSNAGPTISDVSASSCINAEAFMASMNSGGLPRTMSVSTDPGARALTRIPCEANSAAMDRVNETMAALAAEYIETNGEKMKAPAETTLRIAPCWLSRRYGNAAWTRNTGPCRFTEKDFDQASWVISPSGRANALAALLMTMSMPPNSCAVAATNWSIASTSPRWVGTPSALPPPRHCNLSAAAAHASGLRLATATLAPQLTRASAMDRPMPRVPPVTMAVRSLRSKSVRRGSLVKFCVPIVVRLDP